LIALGLRGIGLSPLGLGRFSRGDSLGACADGDFEGDLGLEVGWHGLESRGEGEGAEENSQDGPGRHPFPSGFGRAGSNC
jgi:hypothetical protein